MITILGSTGYIGSAFVREIQKRSLAGWPVTRDKCDYTTVAGLALVLDHLDEDDFVINCAAYIPQPVDLCSMEPRKTVHFNVALPSLLAYGCQERGIPMAHISTGCLYDEDHEYSENEIPLRQMNQYGGFYAVTKYISELAVRSIWEKSYVWRIRLPFDEFSQPKNYLTKIRSHKVVWEQQNSLTHRGDFVKSALDMIEARVPYGVYHMVNEGSIASRELQARLAIDGVGFSLGQGPVPGCRLSAGKLAGVGCAMRTVQEAVKESLRNWREL